MDRTPNSTTEIVYDAETHDYAMYLGGELVGFARTQVEADATLAELVAELTEQGYITPQPPYAALLDVSAGDPEELEGPSEEGGEGGPNPDADPYISALAAHVAREYTAFLAAAPDSPAPSFHQPAPAGGDAASAAGPCDVSGCAAPGSTVWLGRWPAYPARLCGAHRKAVA